MKLYKFILVGLIVATGAVAGCGITGAQWKSATRTFLSGADIACIFASALTDSAELAKVCHIEAALKPAIEEALAGRAASKRAGSCK